MKANRWTKIVVVVLTAVALGAAAGCAPQVAAVGGGEPDTISVTGWGEARGNPDLATVNVGVNVADSSVGEAVELSNETIAAITKAVMALGIEEADIQTTNFNIWPEDIYSPETGQRTGERIFHVDSTVQINVRNIDQSSEVLKVAIENGANNIYGLSFGIADPSDLAAEARKAALADARARAEQMAAELGVSLGEITSVVEQSGGPVFTYFAAAGLGYGGDSPPISQGSLTVSATVQITFEIVR